MALTIKKAVLAVACAVISLTSGCSNDKDTGGEQRKRIMLLTVSEECAYCSLHQQAFRKALADMNVDLDVKITNFDAAEQATQVDQAISQRPDVIVVWPADASAIVPSLRKIKLAGIPIVVTNSQPDRKYAEYWDAFTGPDDVGNGYSAGEALIKGFQDAGHGTKGEVFVIMGPPGTPPQIQRLQGFQNALAKLAPDIIIAGVQPADWDQSKATNAASSLFTQFGSRIAGVYSEADNMMAGVIVAAQRQGIDPRKLVLVGHNCSVEGVTAIEKGDQLATVLQSPIDDGKYAAEAAIKLLNHQPVEPVRYLPHLIKTKANITDCYPAIGR